VAAGAWWWEPKRLVVERHRVRLPRLATALNGLKGAQLTDLHCGPLVSDEYLRSAVSATNALGPDLVCLTGDFISASTKYAPKCADILSGLQAPHGVFAVLGNHDHWTGAHRVQRELERVGVVVLRNR